MSVSQTKQQKPSSLLRTPKPIKKMSIDLSQMYSLDQPTSSGSLEGESMGSLVLPKLRTRRSVHCFESQEAMNDLTRELKLAETRSCNPVPMDLRFQSINSSYSKIDQVLLEDLF